MFSEPNSHARLPLARLCVQEDRCSPPGRCLSPRFSRWTQGISWAPRSSDVITFSRNSHVDEASCPLLKPGKGLPVACPWSHTAPSSFNGALITQPG